MKIILKLRLFTLYMSKKMQNLDGGLLIVYTFVA